MFIVVQCKTLHFPKTLCELRVDLHNIFLFIFYQPHYTNMSFNLHKHVHMESIKCQMPVIHTLNMHMSFVIRYAYYNNHFCNTTHLVKKNIIFSIITVYFVSTNFIYYIIQFLIQLLQHSKSFTASTTSRLYSLSSSILISYRFFKVCFYCLYIHLGLGSPLSLFPSKLNV